MFKIETAVWAALIAALASLILSLINFFSQKRMEKLRKSLELEASRFQKLHELKQLVVELAEGSNHAVELRLAARADGSTQEDLVTLFSRYQENQVKIVRSARGLFRRNAHLLDSDLRSGLDRMMEAMGKSAEVGLMAKAEIEALDTRSLLRERVEVLEGFLPELDSRVSDQLERIRRGLAGS